MPRSLKDLEQYVVSATDGEIERVVDFLLDDEHWAPKFGSAGGGGAERERGPERD